MIVTTGAVVSDTTANATVDARLQDVAVHAVAPGAALLFPAASVNLDAAIAIDIVFPLLAPHVSVKAVPEPAQVLVVCV